MLPPGKTSSAVKHKSVEEIWYIIQGHGQLWRKSGDLEASVDPGQLHCRWRFEVRLRVAKSLDAIGREL